MNRSLWSGVGQNYDAPFTEPLETPEIVISNPSAKNVKIDQPAVLNLDAETRESDRKELALFYTSSNSSIGSEMSLMESLSRLAATGQFNEAEKLCTEKTLKINNELEKFVKDGIGNTKLSPLFLAAKNDQLDLVKLLLEVAKERSQELLVNIINLQQNLSSRKESPISIAASRFHRNSCEAMIESVASHKFRNIVKLIEQNNNKGGGTGFCNLPPESVKKFLEDNKFGIDYHQKNAKEKSLIVVLLRKMPMLVVRLLDESITVAKVWPQDDDENIDAGDIYRIIVDFGVLGHHPFKGKKGKGMDEYDQAGPQQAVRHYSHGLNPLQVLAKTNKEELLLHPVVYALITKKWEKYAKNFYYSVIVLLYIVYFAMLMVYQFAQIKPYTAIIDKNGSITVIVRSWIENDTHKCVDYIDQGCYVGRSALSFTSGSIILVVSVGRLFLEMLDLFNQTFVESRFKNGVDLRTSKSAWQSKFLMYIKIWLSGIGNYLWHTENLLEIVLYSTSLIFSLNILNYGQVISPLHWQIGALSIICSFTNMLLLLRVVPFVGVYITMFFRILWTFMTKILALMFFFLVAFIIIFHMLLSHMTTIFQRPLSGASIYKTLSQGVSGVAYEDYDLEYEDHGLELTFSTSTLIALIGFAIIVQVLFLNLATGLAIQDVKRIRAGAEAAMNVLKIRAIFQAGRSIEVLRVVFPYVPFLRNTKPGLLRRLRRFQNMASKDFNPFVIERIQEIDKRTRSAQSTDNASGANEETVV
ncbi:hypothetical protein ACHWQZ_G004167 [Mnemiopsis leidyi]